MHGCSLRCFYRPRATGHKPLSKTPTLALPQGREILSDAERRPRALCRLQTAINESQDTTTGREPQTRSIRVARYGPSRLVYVQPGVEEPHYLRSSHGVVPSGGVVQLGVAVLVAGLDQRPLGHLRAHRPGAGAFPKRPVEQALFGVEQGQRQNYDQSRRNVYLQYFHAAIVPFRRDRQEARPVAAGAGRGVAGRLRERRETA